MRLHRRHAEMGLRGTYADMRGTYADMCPAAAQGYRGWRYGYVDASTRMDNTSVFYEFVWNPSPENNQIGRQVDARGGAPCPDRTHRSGALSSLT